MGQKVGSKRKTFLGNILFYCLVLIPVSWGSFSINYTYVICYLRGSYKRISNPILAIFPLYLFICYFLSFFGASGNMSVRQLLSFLVYFLGIGLLYVYFSEESIESLIKAVIFVSICYCLWVGIILLVYNAYFNLSDIYSLKSSLRTYVWAWPQSFLPLVVFSFLVIYGRRSKRMGWLSYSVLLLLLVILYFSATRSAYISLLVGLLGYIAGVILKRDRNRYREMFFVLSASALLVAILSVYSETHIVHNLVNLFERIYSAISNFVLGKAPEIGSDAQRIDEWTVAIQTLINYANILTGTGFIGVYNYISAQGSLDSQYFGLLFKVGILGLLFFVYGFIKLLRFWYYRDLAVFAGILSIFVYGAFNETLQLPYTMFLIMALLSHCDSHSKEGACVGITK